MLHNDYFSILDSSVTEQQVIAAGYIKGFTRRSLDGSEVLVQCHEPLPTELESFVVLKDLNVNQIKLITDGPDWHDNTGAL
jgi:hypothetical protein